jgi:IclR family acetate operon transcriptional repressor
LPAITSNTLTSAKSLVQDIERGRARGFFVTSGESVSDVVAIAVPVLARDEVLGAAIAGPRHRTNQVVGRIATQLLEAKKAIEEQQ